MSKARENFRYLQSALSIYALRIIAATSNFLSYAIMGRILGAEQYGMLIYAATNAGLITGILSTGLPTFVTQKIAQFRGHSNERDISRVITFTIIMMGMVVLVAFSLVILQGIAFSQNDNVAQSLLAFAFAVAILNLFTSVASSALFGIEKIFIGQILTTAPPISILLSLVIVWHWGLFEKDALSLQMVLFGTSILVSIATAAFIFSQLARGNFPTLAKLSDIQPSMYAWFKLCMMFGFNQFLINSLTQIDILMLGWQSSSDEVSHYHAASRISYAAAFMFGAISAAANPIFSRLSASASAAELKHFAQNVSIGAFVGTSASGFAIVAIAPIALGLFGASFQDAQPIAVLLVLGWVVQSALGLNYSIMLMSGNVKSATLALAVTAATNALLNLFLIERFGGVGAAIASLVSVSMLSIVLWFFVLRTKGFASDVITSIATKMTKERRA